jgi:hypothetical protein
MMRLTLESVIGHPLTVFGILAFVAGIVGFTAKVFELIERGRNVLGKRGVSADQVRDMPNPFQAPPPNPYKAAVIGGAAGLAVIGIAEALAKAKPLPGLAHSLSQSDSVVGQTMDVIDSSEVVGHAPTLAEHAGSVVDGHDLAAHVSAVSDHVSTAIDVHEAAGHTANVADAVLDFLDFLP